MRKLSVFLLLFSFFFLSRLISQAQNKEIVSFWGAEISDGPWDYNANVFQIRYDQMLRNKFSVQVGLRHQNLITPVTQVASKYIRDAYSSYKLDATFLLVPINNDKFKLKIGVGSDIGKSENFWAGNGISVVERDPASGENFIKTYWLYTMHAGVEYGVHFVMQGNYYIGETVFVSGQILFNQVFNESEYSPFILRKSVLSMNAGIGCRF